MFATGATSARDIRSPFTPTQRQELELQALIFKYMVSGVPIPPELIYSVKRSLDSSMAARLFPPQQIGWGYFQVGFGRKADPEPGRCRRTDGKKWRCSKEAYPDSKYCERHMHRGRNRSRKPVEATSSAPPTPTPTPTINPSPSISSLNRSNISINSSPTSFPPISSELYSHHDPTQKTSTTLLNPFLYNPQTSSSRTVAGSSASSPHDNITTTHHFFFESGTCSQADKDYRFFHEIRETVDERAFFPEASGTVRTLHDSCHPLTMEGSFKPYSDQSQFQSFSQENSKQQQEQLCFVLGTDFKSTRTMNHEKEDEIQKPLHHFFGGEWPPKSPDSWLDLSSNSRLRTDS
ncbi:growth-regulating factor 5-like [Mangifera indica]|uniref:growth-regulating factor 5-like n=1 Tax=Mangifera indica TaxID=29780 RepID=UPI001CFA161A|nr:growth-regulating factor 5-like [Mangifera indica]XP_044485541.1 growth-regulating factor 5-like [Mangifera indica]